MKRYLAENEIRFYTINAMQLAMEVGRWADQYRDGNSLLLLGKHHSDRGNLARF